MSKDSSRQFMVPLILMGMLFFIFGFVTWLNGILIPYLQIACELTNFQAVFVAFSFYISYTLMAIPSARILEKIGFKSGIILGLLIMAVGTALFIPSAMYRTYAAFLLGLFIMGTGLALMQTAVNPYITILGPRETATVRLSIMGICNNVAGAIGPLVLAYYILSDGDEIVNRLKTLDLDSKNLLLDNLSRRVITPYIIMTAVLVGMGALVKLSPLPDIEDDDQDLNEAEESGKTSIFQFPHLILGVITLFVYVGVEVIAANTIFSYGISLGVPIESAKTYTTLVMITMLLGYILGIIAIPRFVSFLTVLKLSAFSGIVFTLFALFIPSEISFFVPWFNIQMPLTIFFIALLGLSNSLVWPAIWPLAIDGLVKFIKQGSALLVMAISGGALLPLAWGLISDNWSARWAYLLVVPAYFIILLYAIYGYKVKKWTRG